MLEAESEDLFLLSSYYLPAKSIDDCATWAIVLQMERFVRQYSLRYGKNISLDFHRTDQPVRGWAAWPPV